jgi:acyl carrier protein
MVVTKPSGKHTSSARPVDRLHPKLRWNMTMATIAAQVKRILARQLDLDESLITLDTSWDDLESNSIDQHNIIAAFEEEFGVELTADDAGQLQTVGETVTVHEQEV